MRGIVAHRQDAAVDRRVQRLDAAVHHLGKAGEVGDVAHVMPRFAQRLCGAAGRHQLDAMADERGGKLGEPRLVADGKKRAADGNQVGHGKGGLCRDGKDADPLGACAPYRKPCRPLKASFTRIRGDTTSFPSASDQSPSAAAIWSQRTSLKFCALGALSPSCARKMPSG